ncbi:pilus assembly protein CpaF [Motilibacter peucedani]|uniref:Pilus assembly protein CpaF n=1 Tax=Motilibacter peucedani TaxID=598650 RepID=A0A420XQ19_9ACTN|nr:TadA family conjugal transfer-associated ATPase [Motilibacter peucedani]RKS75360.1 pilus assembly protein CpaF [Motilibacter peucedani]
MSDLLPRPDEALMRRLRGRLAAEPGLPTTARLAALVREEAALLGGPALLHVVEALRAELAGAGPLEVLLADPAVTDVLVNGPDDVWVDRGAGLVRASVGFDDEADVRRVAERLSARAGRRLDEASPWVDGRLPGGVRLHAVLPPVAADGTLVSLRVPAREAFTLEGLEASGAVAPRAAELLRLLVASRLSFVVTGGTGSGKTTLLGVLLGLVDARERLVLVEDTAELRPDHPHVVRLEGRPPNLEGVGAVHSRDLVRQALRMRPDRLVVGEVRGGEVVELLAALNTGHEGGCGTLHARSAGAVPARVEALATAAGLGREAAHAQLAAGLDAVVHVGRDRSGARHVDCIALVSRPAGEAWCRVEPVWERSTGDGPAAADLHELADRLGGGR